MPLRPVRAVFSGGPANNRRAVINDQGIAVFPVVQDICWEFDDSENDKEVEVKYARYRKTKHLDDKLCVIYEFIGY